MKQVLLVLSLAVAALAGCTATPAVLTEHDAGINAAVAHARGTTSLVNELRDLYAERERADIDALTESFLVRIEAGGQVDGAEVAGAARLLIAKRDEARARVVAFIAAVDAKRDANAANLATALRAGALLREYITSGVDAKEVEPYIASLRALVESKTGALGDLIK